MSHRVILTRRRPETTQQGDCFVRHGACLEQKLAASDRHTCEAGVSEDCAFEAGACSPEGGIAGPQRPLAPRQGRVGPCRSVAASSRDPPDVPPGAMSAGA